MPAYREKFEKIQSYFAPRFAEANKVGNEMIRTIEDNLKSRRSSREVSMAGEDRTT